MNTREKRDDPQPSSVEPRKEGDAGAPFISVAVPTFGRPDVIRRAIDSVLHQGFSDWELVVSDDEGAGSQTWAIVERYAREDARIRLVANAGQRGQVGNTNNAMRMSRGQWVKLLHDDDWLAPEALSTFAAVALAHPSAAFVTSAVNSIFDDKVRIRMPPRKGEAVSVYSSQACLEDLYLVGETRMLGIVPSSLMINRKVIDGGCLMRNYKSVQSGVDQVLFVDLACHGEMVVIRDGLVFYDGTYHSNVTRSSQPSNLRAEALDQKKLIWSLLENTNGLPGPEVVVRALRVARLPAMVRRQSWRETLIDATNVFRPSVVELVCATMLDRARRRRRGDCVQVRERKRSGPFDAAANSTSASFM